MPATGAVGKLIEDAAFGMAKTDATGYHYNVSLRWDLVMSEALRKQGVEILRISPMVGKRESRRFLGDYVLTETDCESGRIFDDAIAVGGFAVDIHYPINRLPVSSIEDKGRDCKDYLHREWREIPGFLAGNTGGRNIFC